MAQYTVEAWHRETKLSLPVDWVAFLSSFHQKILTVPGTGMTEMTQICSLTQGVHRWMRVSLVLVVTGFNAKLFHFRLEEAYAHPWAGQ